MGHALLKGHAGSRGVKVNGACLVEPRPTSVRAVEPSPDDP